MTPRLIARAAFHLEPDGTVTTTVTRAGEFRVSLLGNPDVSAAASALENVLTVIARNGGTNGQKVGARACGPNHVDAKAPQ